MWYKVIVAVILIAITVTTWFILHGQNNASNQPIRAMIGHNAIRSAYKVNMQEMDLEKKTITVVKAAKITEKETNKFLLTAFSLEQQDRLHLVGDRAYYDMDTSRLLVDGHIIADTKDGYKGYFQNLTWDKATQSVSTDKPLHLITKEATLDANQAWMQDDLSIISLRGGINAKVDSDRVLKP